MAYRLYKCLACTDNDYLIRLLMLKKMGNIDLTAEEDDYIQTVLEGKVDDQRWLCATYDILSEAELSVNQTSFDVFITPVNVYVEWVELWDPDYIEGPLYMGSTSYTAESLNLSVGRVYDGPRPLNEYGTDTDEDIMESPKTLLNPKYMEREGN